MASFPAYFYWIHHYLLFVDLPFVYKPEFHLLKGVGKAFLLSTLFFIGFNLLMGLTGGIDNAAHIGGLVSGFIIGLIITPSLKKETIPG
jgi:membrane associated rhomboid family serine protease